MKLSQGIIKREGSKAGLTAWLEIKKEVRISRAAFNISLFPENKNIDIKIFLIKCLVFPINYRVKNGN
jgi:hypothetical protein